MKSGIDSMRKVMKYIFAAILMMPTFVYGNFPMYVEINVGETVHIDGYPKIMLLAKKVSYYDSLFDRIGAAEVQLKIDDEEINLPVGYENFDAVVKDIRIGVEVIKDYEQDFVNERFHLTKDARLRIAKANEPLMEKDSHCYPLFTPWNSGARTQGWLTVCYNILALEGKSEVKANRYHDGWDFGAWEGELVRSVCTGTVVSPDDYPELINSGQLYNKNGTRIGTNPFLVKPADLPILYYYTHLSGLARNFREGEIIQKGDVLGYASARGSSGGWFHLHFSIIHLEKKIHVNPFPFLAEWYADSMPYYQDFLTDFNVHYYQNDSINKIQFEKAVTNNKINPTGKFINSLPGVVHVRETVAKAPFSGLNHVVFDQFAVLKTYFNNEKKAVGEIWFGHTGKARVYLNGELIYHGENDRPYHRSKQPFQWDSEMMQVNFLKGENEIAVAIEQTNPFWSFSVRPRSRLGLPLFD